MKAIKYMIAISCSLLVSFFCSCASFRAGNLPPISQWPPAQVEKEKSISLIISGESIVNGKDTEVNSRMLSIWRDQTFAAYRESGLFSFVEVGLAENDLRAEVKILDQGSYNAGLAFLTGFTLYLIPSKASDEFIVKTTIKDEEGNTLGSFEKSENINFWQQLFLIFALPANSPISVPEETLYDLNRATIIEAHSQGII